VLCFIIYLLMIGILIIPKFDSLQFINIAIGLNYFGIDMYCSYALLFLHIQYLTEVSTPLNFL